MTLHEKSQEHVLYACQNHGCSVVMFIRTETCPLCNEQGFYIRGIDWDRGAPPDPGRGYRS